MVGATPAPDGTQVRLVPCVGLVWEGGPWAKRLQSFERGADSHAAVLYRLSRCVPESSTCETDVHPCLSPSRPRAKPIRLSALPASARSSSAGRAGAARASPSSSHAPDATSSSSVAMRDEERRLPQKSALRARKDVSRAASFRATCGCLQTSRRHVIKSPRRGDRASITSPSRARVAAYRGSARRQKDTIRG